KRAMREVAEAAKYKPLPVASPIAATVHKPEAVVNPRITPLFRNRIVPAPIKPTPLITCAATLEGSSSTLSNFKTSIKPYIETIIIKQEPTETIEWVRKPADQFFLSLSKPIKAPRKAASRSLPIVSVQESISGSIFSFHNS